ncbi:HigA family addiction module antitoxin [Rhizobium sp. ZPR3]|uniref:HigA family addiction module antitoxin n=2 Tax=unclassified Rhizobium TaxID=2613769 RepID=A0AAU7SRF8_9HYPH
MRRTKSDVIRAPVHPGRFVKTDVIEPLGLTVTAAADVLGVTRAALSALLNERADLSPEMAIRIGKAFGVAMETLMRMQNSFDIAVARKKAEDIDVSPYKGKSSQQIVSL